MQTNGTVHRWEELTREMLREIASSCTVIVPLGAVEQHGPYLPTGTDSILSNKAVALAAVDAAKKSGETFVIAPFLRIGASEHHLPFGGTISVSPETLLLFLTEALRSMGSTGVQKIVLVNGHGGNSGVCHAAGSAISTTTDMAVAVLDYWEAAPDVSGSFQVPGHAGRWETSLILATCPELVRTRHEREQHATRSLPGRGVYSRKIWSDIDGYTDEPENASAEEGENVWNDLVPALGSRLADLARTMR